MEEDGSSTPNTMPTSPDFNLMDELLYDGFWLEATNVSDSPQPHPTSFDFPTSETYNVEDASVAILDLPGEPALGEDVIPSVSLNQSTRLWFGPNGNSIRAVSVKKRLVQAIDCLKDSITDKDVLIQIWIPVKRGGRQVLTTNDQPFSLNPHCKNLADYRNVSESYHFSADAEAKEFFGLPGRVFLNKFPDWTPDVRFFRREEYPRVNHAQLHDVRGSLALPVFGQGRGICLGVVEIVTTRQKVNFSPELENVCKALEAVNLKSSNNLSPCNVEVQIEPYQDALTQINHALKYICDAHKLPLAQTWASCAQQRKGGCRHANENYACCVSMIESACYVADEQVSGFQEACSGYHLLKGEGVVGKAFLTNQPCFSEDITAYSKTEYPLAHHARVFNLCASVAIRLRSANNVPYDFVLEFFFLRLNCKDGDDQKLMLESLSSVIQEKCRSIRVITDQELAQENHPKLVTSPPKEQEYKHSHDDPQDKGKGLINVSEQQESTQWDKSGLDLLLDYDDAEGSGNFPLTTGNYSLGAKTSNEKRCTKIKKTISLEVLRQYYAGSLKEAAMSIGVCPTTLKRICRQHGITRWPSRKIKKVGRSLKKLQGVIDSVQGADGSIQLSSFYNNFPELVSPNVPGMGDYLQKLDNQPEGPTLFSPTNTASKSLSSSSANRNSNSSYCHRSIGVNLKQSSLSAGRMLKRAPSEAQMHENGQDKTNLLIRSYSHKNFSDDSPAIAKNGNWVRHVDTLRVKVAFGEEKVRLSLQPQWGFKDLQGEVFRRFNIENGSSFSLKYLDDDAEWVLLTCDADLEELGADRLDCHVASREVENDIAEDVY
ncbi:protein nlp2 [Phtheirospermum japonicum]|uniref:Protein nlp2 n=1 Tax=Phtheirospermum japonicum TaxID=374723 RepID=A0A830CRN8_9LAMI|nr:protein nlp2 [Phtheirospermum japonicum]